MQTMMRHFLFLMITASWALVASAQTSRIYIEDFEIEPGTTDTVQAIFASVDSSRGLQFNVSLSAGLDIVDGWLTDYSKGFSMVGSCTYSSKNDCYLMFIYPTDFVCYPADTVAAVMNILVEADPDFSGGTITTWQCRGSTIDNNSIPMEGDTTTVSTPAASIIAIPADGSSKHDQYFNMMGQPIDTPASAPVAIQVTTRASGERTARKVAVGH